MKFLHSIDRAVAKVEGWLIVIFLTLMIVMTFFQVVLRALFTHGHLQWANSILGQVDWFEPFVRLLVLWLTFLGASLLTKEDKHIKIDLMSSLLPSRWLPFRDIILSIGAILILIFMLKFSIDYIRIEMAFEGYLFLKVSNWIVQLILPFGFSIILFRFFLRGIEQILKIFRDENL